MELKIAMLTMLNITARRSTLDVRIWRLKLTPHRKSKINRYSNEPETAKYDICDDFKLKKNLLISMYIAKHFSALRVKNKAVELRGIVPGHINCTHSPTKHMHTSYYHHYYCHILAFKTLIMISTTFDQKDIWNSVDGHYVMMLLIYARALRKRQCPTYWYQLLLVPLPNSHLCENYLPLPNSHLCEIHMHTCINCNGDISLHAWLKIADQNGQWHGRNVLLYF